MDLKVLSLFHFCATSVICLRSIPISTGGRRKGFNENLHHPLFAFLARRIDIHLHCLQKATKLLKRQDKNNRHLKQNVLQRETQYMAGVIHDLTIKNMYIMSFTCQVTVAVGREVTSHRLLYTVY